MIWLCLIVWAIAGFPSVDDGWLVAFIVTGAISIKGGAK